MTRANLDEFIAINAPFMTRTELAEEAGTNPVTINNICKRLGVRPITKRERAEEYILSHMHQTIKEIAMALNMKEHNLYGLFKDLGLKFPPSKEIDKPIGYFNGRACNKPVIKFSLKPDKSKAGVFKEFAEKHGSGFNYTDLVYPKEVSWNI